MHFNDFLNETVRNASDKNQVITGVPRVPVDYKHRYEIDRFFELPSRMRGQLPPYVESLIPPHHSLKVRVTYEEKSKAVLAKIIKARVADIDIYMPTCPLDCRISVNLEMPWETSVEELEQLSAGMKRDGMPDRNKDRLSYQHGPYQIDLTQVRTSIAVSGKVEQERMTLAFHC